MRNEIGIEIGFELWALAETLYRLTGCVEFRIAGTWETFNAGAIALFTPVLWARIVAPSAPHLFPPTARLRAFPPLRPVSPAAVDP